MSKMGKEIVKDLKQLVNDIEAGKKIRSVVVSRKPKPKPATRVRRTDEVWTPNPAACGGGE